VNVDARYLWLLTPRHWEMQYSGSKRNMSGTCPRSRRFLNGSIGGSDWTVTGSDAIGIACCNVYRDASKRKASRKVRENEHPEKRGHRERPNTGSILAGTRRARVCAGYWIEHNEASQSVGWNLLARSRCRKLERSERHDLRVDSRHVVHLSNTWSTLNLSYNV